MSREAEGPLPPKDFEALLRREAPELGVALTKEALGPTATYLSTLDAWRRRINLTGDLSSRDLVRHSLESVLGGRLIAHGERVVDVGSGAGFPGVPLAISRPDLSVSLVEPRLKRAAFLRHVVRSLPLANAVVVQKRIEEVEEDPFDVATTRGVGDLPKWLGKGSLIRPGGKLLAWTTRAARLDQELSPAFRPETVLAVPGSRSRKIAVYCRV